jgi:hypothetical protein
VHGLQKRNLVQADLRQPATDRAMRDATGYRMNLLADAFFPAVPDGQKLVA